MAKYNYTKRPKGAVKLPKTGEQIRYDRKRLLEAAEAKSAPTLPPFDKFHELPRLVQIDVIRNLRLKDRWAVSQTNRKFFDLIRDSKDQTLDPRPHFELLFVNNETRQVIATEKNCPSSGVHIWKCEDGECSNRQRCNWIRAKKVDVEFRKKKYMYNFLRENVADASYEKVVIFGGKDANYVELSTIFDAFTISTSHCTNEAVWSFISLPQAKELLIELRGPMFFESLSWTIEEELKDLTEFDRDVRITRRVVEFPMTKQDVRVIKTIEDGVTEFSIEFPDVGELPWNLPENQ